MPQFILNRDHTLNSLFGHVITFQKGQPVNVPDVCIKEVVAIGAECVDGPVDVLGELPKEEAFMPTDERRENILAAFALLEEGNERDNFTASGTPSKAALVKVLGFSIDKKEYEPLWIEYLGSKG